MVAPKLRFNEFDESWSSIPLKNFVSFRKGKGISKADIKEDGIFECIRYGELYTTYGQVITTIKSRTNISPSESILSQSGDVIIPASGETQIDIATAACVAKENVILGGDLNILSHHENGEWLAYYLSSAKKLEIAQLAQGNSVVHLYSSQLKELKINKPSKTEQTKIATFLSAVDEKIAQLSQKRHLLEQYKQGMMQKIFSQQIRFKAGDGSEFGEWEYYKLGELTTLITKGTTPTSLGGKFENSGINFIKIESLSSDGKFLLDKFAYIDEVTHNKLARSQLENEDILFSIAGALGRVAIISNDYLPANTNQALAIIRLRNKNIIRYIYYFLNSDYVKKIIETESVQLAQANFSLGQLSDLDIVLPCIEEQTKIANFLSAIDQKFDVVSEQLKQAKTWKKGLLQQMFV